MLSNADTIPKLFLYRVAATPRAVAFLYPDGSRWRSLTWRDTYERVRDAALGLHALGVKEGECCAILSNTRVEWLLADLAILSAGGITTTIYPASVADECAFIIEDSGCVLVFAEDAAQVEKLRSIRSKLPQIRNVVVMDANVAGDDWVLTLDQLMAKGREAAGDRDAAFEASCQVATNQSLATLIYTSGTTGRPKGVELTHDCWVYEGEALDRLHMLSIHDVQYLWLPLAHSFGKVLEVAQLRIGFRTAVDGRVEELANNLGVVRPTFVAAVPRVFEKIRAKVIEGAHTGGAAKRVIFDNAMEVGRKVSQLRQNREPIPRSLDTQFAVADRLVFSKLKQRFGGRLRFFISGSAPLAREVGEFFHAADILICEGYGLTETSAASFVNLPRQYKFGTVGAPVPGTEVRIADDGEILVRGRSVMRGYHNLPEATAEVLEPDGWFHTGDIGTLDGPFLRITDRKKDLIKTSGGKYIAPQLLEAQLKLLCPQISQVLVHGERRNYCTALIALDPEGLEQWAEQHDLGTLGYAQLTQHPQVEELVRVAVDELNSKLARYETIKKFRILPEDLSVENGGLTPSMKLKRKAVEEQYGHLLDSLYESKAPARASTGTHGR